MEYLNDRTWPYHGMIFCALKVRASVLNKFWRNHISDKYGFSGCTVPYVRRPFAAVPKATFSCAIAFMGKVEGWKEETGEDRTSPHPYGYILRLLCAMDERDTHPWTCRQAR